jgi:Zn-dependent alcohol dehydrogenase
VPELVDRYLAGASTLESLVTRRVALDQINDASRRWSAGRASAGHTY